MRHLDLPVSMERRSSRLSSSTHPNEPITVPTTDARIIIKIIVAMVMSNSNKVISTIVVREMNYKTIRKS